MEKYQCQGTNKNGKQCRRMLREKGYCKTHSSHTPRYAKEDCPVCFDEIKSNLSLPCGHWVHKKCIIKSGKLECPICRGKCESIFTEKQKLKCESIKYKFERQQILEDEEEIFNMLLDDDFVLEFGEILDSASTSEEFLNVTLPVLNEILLFELYQHEVNSV